MIYILPSICCLQPHSTCLTLLPTSLTCTDHSCVSTVGTVMHSKTNISTLSEAGFTASAFHIGIPNWTTSSSICRKSSCSSAITQLTTDPMLHDETPLHALDVDQALLPVEHLHQLDWRLEGQQCKVTPLHTWIPTVRLHGKYNTWHSSVNGRLYQLP